MKHDKREVLERSARFGFLARGAVYLTIGVLAAMWAFGEDGGQISGGEGIVYRVSQLPGGTALLALLGIGLAAYALWRGFCAVVAPGESDHQARTWLRRLGWGLSALANGFLAFTCFQALGLGGGGGGNKRTYLAELLATGWGRGLVIAIGMFLIAAGLRHLYVAYTESFTEKLDTARMSAEQRRWTIRLGRIGIAARGVVFPIIGFFLVKAGIAANPSQAKGVGGALREIASQSYGTVLLALVAIGLAAFGVYSAISAKYRRLPV